MKCSSCINRRTRAWRPLCCFHSCACVRFPICSPAWHDSPGTLKVTGVCVCVCVCQHSDPESDSCSFVQLSSVVCECFLRTTVDHTGVLSSTCPPPPPPRPPCKDKERGTHSDAQRDWRSVEGPSDIWPSPASRGSRRCRLFWQAGTGTPRGPDGDSWSHWRDRHGDRSSHSCCLQGQLSKLWRCRDFGSRANVCISPILWPNICRNPKKVKLCYYLFFNISLCVEIVL